MPNSARGPEFDTDEPKCQRLQLSGLAADPAVT